MAYKLTWLAQVLRDAGLKVVEQPGWQDRGHGDVTTVKGVICHHTASAKIVGNIGLDVLVKGRPDLSGPLCNLGLGRDGTFYVIAAGRAYHAGAGNWQGMTDGNHQMIGIEAENTGLANDQPWPKVQMDAYAKGCAALVRKLGHNETWVCGHKEYALPKGRKSDPSFDMIAFRGEVAKYLGTWTVTPPPDEEDAGDDEDEAVPIASSNQPLFEQLAPRIMNDLIHDLLLTPTEAAAVLGNIGTECNGFKSMQEIHPTSGAGGYGWCQWTGPRRTAFFNWCDQQHLSKDSYEGNYSYLLHELRNSEKSAVPAMKAVQTLDQAVEAFEQHFERAGVKNYPSRKAYARRALAAYNVSSYKRGITPAPTPKTAPVTPGKATTGVVVAGGSGAAVAKAAGVDWTTVSIIGLAVIVIAVSVFFIMRARRNAMNGGD